MCRGEKRPVPSSSSSPHGHSVLLSPPIRRTEVLQPDPRVPSPQRAQTGSLRDRERTLSSHDALRDSVEEDNSLQTLFKDLVPDDLVCSESVFPEDESLMI